MRFTAWAFLGMALLLSGHAVWSQTTPARSQGKPPMTEEEKEEEDKAKAETEAKAKAKREADAWSQFFFEEVLQRSCDDPTLESAIALPQPKLTLHATDEGKGEIKARVGFEVKKIVASLELKSPRKSSEETTTLASLEGLSKGSTLDLKISWFGWDLKNDLWKEIERMREEWATSAESSKGPAYEAMKKVVGPRVGTEGDMADFMKSVISRPSGRALLGSARYDEAAAAYRDWIRAEGKKIPVFTLNGHAEQKDFNFFIPSAGPPAGLKQTSESHTNYRITGSVGAYLWGSVYSSLNYSRGTEFEGGKMKDFCTASSVTGVLSCQSLTIAPPKKGRAEKLEFEARGLAGPVGFGTHVTRDLQTNVTMVDVPVYLLQNLSTSKMELNLGARLQWRSDTRKYAVSVFIGPALSSVLRMGQ
ncbi:MAG: hypothetical protein ACJ76Y_03795 [Thermoanaerobaculia bacterium]